ncbi:hypothetical protein DFH94DRAFT_214702 [Russula ochroleuca]|uniref:Uncharacterized protein n=1 Tax=Russula ochroleuca TaxID=152965 RepID=A0A9P5MP64_9AGAM|nr:hypothetical protein DFH94DRAFT_214702 [Russula ochroleuca]
MALNFRRRCMPRVALYPMPRVWFACVCACVRRSEMTLEMTSVVFTNHSCSSPLHSLGFPCAGVGWVGVPVKCGGVRADGRGKDNVWPRARCAADRRLWGTFSSGTNRCYRVYPTLPNPVPLPSPKPSTQIHIFHERKPVHEQTQKREKWPVRIGFVSMITLVCPLHIVLL